MALSLYSPSALPLPLWRVKVTCPAQEAVACGWNLLSCSFTWAQFLKHLQSCTLAPWEADWPQLPGLCYSLKWCPDQSAGQWSGQCLTKGLCSGCHPSSSLLLKLPRHCQPKDALPEHWCLSDSLWHRSFSGMNFQGFSEFAKSQCTPKSHSVEVCCHCPLL